MVGEYGPLPRSTNTGFAKMYTGVRLNASTTNFFSRLKQTVLTNNDTGAQVSHEGSLTLQTSCAFLFVFFFHLLTARTHNNFHTYIVNVSL